jgi:site-specific recombinase XerD
MYNLASRKLDRITSDFTNYLASCGLSKNSIRFYKSDLSHFTAWVIFKVKALGVTAESLQETVPFLKPSVAFDYKKSLSENNAAAKTINRRLSTLRRFSQFLFESKAIAVDFAKEVENIQQQAKNSNSQLKLTENFEEYLRKEKAAENTVKSYVADVKHFLDWINKNYAT